jgi:hypothetical protein
MTHPSVLARAARRVIATPFLLLTLAVVPTASSEPDPGSPAPLGDSVVLSWNDLGMHCMNQTHANLSILPPYNTLLAQVILRGDAQSLPRLLTEADGITLEYSIPGNTYSVGKTDFWTYAFDLFGVDLPDDIGLTGKGLTGVLDPRVGHFTAEGIPITPFPDATPTTEDPYQQALIIVRDGEGAEMGTSAPVVPVSTEIRCVSAGCHASEQAILQGHEREHGYDPDDTPILCAGCHASPALGTVGIEEAGYFSRRIHDKHDFLDEDLPGIEGCYRCHPGVHARCLRGTMGTDYGMICQDCHGDMREMARSIEDGRIPWLIEPACRTCHSDRYGEPSGQLYRHSAGHGGVMCSGCHHSPHAIYPSSEPRDNANVIALQGVAGTLSDCAVCHGIVPAGPGPHGTISGFEESILTSTGIPLRVSPNPLVTGSRIEIPVATEDAGRLAAFDANGRTVAVFTPRRAEGGSWFVQWDGSGRGGRPAGPGVYYLRWQNGEQEATGKLVIQR